MAESSMVRTMTIGAIVLVLFVSIGGGDLASASPAGAPQARNLDELLAPIALYPDQLLAQILMSASDPDSVTRLDQWLAMNQAMKGTQLQNAAVKAGFEPSFVALALFPSVVAQMATEIERTALVGQAFAADRNAVFATIQRLRHQAQDIGTLKTTPQQEVTSTLR